MSQAPLVPEVLQVPVVLLVHWRRNHGGREARVPLNIRSKGSEPP